MKGRLALIAMVFILSLASCARSPGSSIERRIERVERGLVSAPGDPPGKRMNLAERMVYHKVPGVSIAAINDYQVEWARGYGVLEAGGNDGYKSVMVAYPERGQGIVIMTNGDNGEALMREILKSASIEYGWLGNYTFLHVGIVAAIVLAVVGILVVRKRRRRSVQRNGTG